MWHRSRSLRHMLPPSLRLLVRHRARSVPLQLRRLKSTDTRPDNFTDFLGWTRKNRGKHRAEPSRPRPGDARGGKSLKRRDVKTDIKKPEWFNTAFVKPPKAKTRERRILETVQATVRKKRPSTPGANDINSWRPEDWKTDGWGLDSESRVLNLSTIEWTYPDTPGQGSSPHPQIEILWLRSRSLGVRNRHLKGQNGCPVTKRKKVTWIIPAGLKVCSFPWGFPCYKVHLFLRTRCACTLTVPIDVAPLTEHRPIATLAHKLDRVLFKWAQPLSHRPVVSFNIQSRCPLATRAEVWSL